MLLTRDKARAWRASSKHTPDGDHTRAAQCAQARSAIHVNGRLVQLVTNKTDHT